MSEDKMKRVLNMVSVITGLPEEDILKRKKIEYVDARRIISFIIVKGGLAKLEKTGMFLGKKHTNIMFYLRTIHLVNKDHLERSCNACQSFIDLNLNDYEDIITIVPREFNRNVKISEIYQFIFKNSNHE